VQKKTEPCLLLRLDSIGAVPETPDAEALDRLIADVRGGPEAPPAAIARPSASS
jgi:hypothetical protein